MVGVICFWDRLATPYLGKYEKLLEKAQIPYKVVLWNRIGIGETERVTYSRNEIVVSNIYETGIVKKSLSFLRWKHVVTKIINKQKFDQLIILSTVPAVLLYNTLIHKYKNQYLFDIRDYTMEANTFFKRIVMSLVNNSMITGISSKGYMRWLDQSDKIMINHNITINQRGQTFQPPEHRKSKIRFSFVGNVRLDEQTEALMLLLNNHKRIEQHFYGRIIPHCNIEKVVQMNGIHNIELHGAFDVKDKPNFFQNIDLINCVYANAKEEDKIPLGDSTPLPNRLYDALIFRRPIVASKGTYLAELVYQYNLGCVVNGFDENAPSQIVEYFDTFDREEFAKGCEKLKAVVVEEEKRYVQKVQEIFKSWQIITEE